MKLSNIIDIGRYKNPETGTFVNVKRGRYVGRSVDITFYIFKGKQQLISDLDFYDNWVGKPKSK